MGSAHFWVVRPSIVLHGAHLYSLEVGPRFPGGVMRDSGALALGLLSREYRDARGVMGTAASYYAQGELAVMPS